MIFIRTEFLKLSLGTNQEIESYKDMKMKCLIKLDLHYIIAVNLRFSKIVSSLFSLSI